MNTYKQNDREYCSACRCDLTADLERWDAMNIPSHIAQKPAHECYWFDLYTTSIEYRNMLERVWEEEHQPRGLSPATYAEIRELLGGKTKE